MFESNIGDVAHAIQLALTPVFLLTGIAGLLNVMMGRLTRIIDRGRRLSEQTTPHDASVIDNIRLEISGLERRHHSVHVFCIPGLYRDCGTVFGSAFANSTQMVGRHIVHRIDFGAGGWFGLLFTGGAYGQPNRANSGSTLSKDLKSGCRKIRPDIVH